MKIATILGTRPEIIKMAPIIDEISKRDIDQIVLHTGQHYDKEMSDNFFKDLEIPTPDYNIRVGSGTHGKQTGLMMQGIEEVLMDEKPDIVLVQGVVDALHDVAHNIDLLYGIYPAEQLEIDAAVAELGEDGAHLFLLVDVGMLKVDNSILYHSAHLFHVGAVGHVERYQR
jgi:type III secretory pathway component EscV